MKESFLLSKVYSLLESGPVVMVSSAWKGKANIMTMSWHTMIDFEGMRHKYSHQRDREKGYRLRECFRG